MFNSVICTVLLQAPWRLVSLPVCLVTKYRHLHLVRRDRSFTASCRSKSFHQHGRTQSSIVYRKLHNLVSVDSNHTNFPTPQYAIMGKAGKSMRAFIDKIPNSKLEGGIGVGTIYTDHENFRLDNQGVSEFIPLAWKALAMCFQYTTIRDGRPLMYNIQLQVNNNSKLSSLAVVAPDTIAAIQVPVYPPTLTADQIKAVLVAELIRKGYLKA